MKTEKIHLLLIYIHIFFSEERGLYRLLCSSAFRCNSYLAKRLSLLVALHSISKFKLSQNLSLSLLYSSYKLISLLIFTYFKKVLNESELISLLLLLKNFTQRYEIKRGVKLCFEINVLKQCQCHKIGVSKY